MHRDLAEVLAWVEVRAGEDPGQVDRGLAEGALGEAAAERSGGQVVRDRRVVHRRFGGRARVERLERAGLATAACRVDRGAGPAVDNDLDVDGRAARVDLVGDQQVAGGATRDVRIAVVPRLRQLIELERVERVTGLRLAREGEVQERVRRTRDARRRSA